MSTKSPKQKATRQEKALAEVGAKYWADYMDRGKKTESAYRDRLAKLGSDAEVSRATSAGLNRFEGGMGFGLNPLNAGDVIGQEQGRGRARAAIASGAHTGAQDQHQAGQQGIVALGRNIRSDGDSALTRSAIDSQKGEQARLYAAQLRAGGLQDLAGVGAGYGLYKWGTRPGVERLAPAQAIDQSLDNAWGVSPAARDNLLNIKRGL